MTSPTVGRRVISVMQQSFNGSFNCKSEIKEYGLTQAGVLFALSVGSVCTVWVAVWDWW